MIPLVRPLFPSREDIWKYFDPALASGQISNMGVCYTELTKQLSEFTRRHALPVVNGTVAIQVAVQQHFPRGSHILVPDYTHIGTLQAVIGAGCNPVLAPVSSQTWTLDPKALDEALGRAAGAIVVSPFGYPVDFAMYDAIAKKHKKPLVYDLAGAWGMNIGTKHTACMSLHATKNFSCGEGGVVLFSRKGQYLDSKRRANFETYPDRSIASPYGGNWKPDELKCAVALAHLENHDKILARASFKKNLALRYAADLHAYVPTLTNSAPSLCVVQGLPAKLIEKECHRHGFVAKQYYPLLSGMRGLKDVPSLMPSAPRMENCLALPSDVTWEEADQVIVAVKRILRST